jgi:hypothetical protein
MGLRTILWSGQSLWITTISSSSYPRSVLANLLHAHSFIDS